MKNFSDYEKLVKDTAKYPREAAVIYPVLGLNGEAGEVASLPKEDVFVQGMIFKEICADLRL